MGMFVGHLFPDWKGVLHKLFGCWGYLIVFIVYIFRRSTKVHKKEELVRVKDLMIGGVQRGIHKIYTSVISYQYPVQLEISLHGSAYIVSTISNQIPLMNYGGKSWNTLLHPKCVIPCLSILSSGVTILLLSTAFGITTLLVLWSIFECLITVLEYCLPSEFQPLRYIPVSNAEGYILVPNTAADPTLKMNRK